MKVQDVMTRTVVSVRPETPLKDVAALMVEHGISGVPVVDEQGMVLGVVSEADFIVKERGLEGVRHRPLARFLGRADEARAEIAKVQAATAGSAMSSPAITIEADRPVREAAAVMIEREINRLPVVEDGRLVGIVTRADLVRAYLRPDDELERVIRDEVLVKELWVDPADIEIRVERGVVHLRGTVDRRSTADLVARHVARVEGVVAVDSELAWRLDDSQIRAPAPDYFSPYHRA
ncbi:MAG: CBS domain-containing protein [Chloroflexota bacterium]